MRSKEIVMTRPRRAVIVNSAVFTLAVLGLAVTSARGQDVVKIGQIEAQTGANAIYGWLSSQGAALAVDEINKAGGFKVGSKTYKIQLIALDTRGEPKEATVQLKRLIEVDQAKYIFGPFLSNVFLAVRPYAGEEDVGEKGSEDVLGLVHLDEALELDRRLLGLPAGVQRDELDLVGLAPDLEAARLVDLVHRERRALRGHPAVDGVGARLGLDLADLHDVLTARRSHRQPEYCQGKNRAVYNNGSSRSGHDDLL